jgi:hypothetical protein
MVRDAERTRAAFAVGGLALCNLENFGRTPPVLEGTRWTERAVGTGDNAGRVLDCSGMFHAETGLGTVESVTLSLGNGRSVLILAGGWTFNDVFGRMLASTVLSFDSAGLPEQARHLQQIKPLTRRDCEAAFAIPKPASADPIRGEIRLRAIRDYRNGGEFGVLTAVSPSGELGEPVDFRQDRQTIVAVRWLGWVVLACAGSLAALLTMRRLRGRGSRRGD